MVDLWRAHLGRIIHVMAPHGEIHTPLYSRSHSPLSGLGPRENFSAGASEYLDPNLSPIDMYIQRQI